MVGNATMEAKVRSLPYLNIANDTVLLNNVRKGGEIVLFRTFCSFIDISMVGL
jgi:hypothetical protein